MSLLAAEKNPGVNVRSVGQVFTWGKALACELIVDRLGPSGLLGSGLGRIHVGNQMGTSVSAGFGQMNHISGPTGAEPGPVAGLRVIGRFDRIGGRTKLLYWEKTGLSVL